MTNPRVRRVQELRRSNAAQPRPGKRLSDYSWESGIDFEECCTCPCHYGPDHCVICTNDYADLCG